MEHANNLVRILVPLISIIIIVTIFVARRKDLYIRRIQGLTAIDEAIGRATEMGRPMTCLTGLGQNGGIEIVTLQALSIITYIIRSSARFGTRAICPVYDPQMLAVTEEAVQDAYTAEGRPEQFVGQLPQQPVNRGDAPALLECVCRVLNSPILFALRLDGTARRRGPAAVAARARAAAEVVHPALARRRAEPRGHI